MYKAFYHMRRFQSLESKVRVGVYRTVCVMGIFLEKV